MLFINSGCLVKTTEREKRLYSKLLKLDPSCWYVLGYILEPLIQVWIEFLCNEIEMFNKHVACSYGVINLWGSLLLLWIWILLLIESRNPNTIERFVSSFHLYVWPHKNTFLLNKRLQSNMRSKSNSFAYWLYSQLAMRHTLILRVPLFTEGENLL